MENAHPLEQYFLEGKIPVTARISKIPELCLDSTCKMLKEAKIEQYIVAQEGSDTGETKPHQHLLVYDVQVDLLRDLIKKHYKISGNKFLSVSVARKKNQILKYTVKEGNYIYKGFTDDFMKTLERLSHPKTNMVDEFHKLEDLLLLNTISKSEYLLRYLKLKIKYKQPIYTNHLIAYFRSRLLTDNELEEYAEDLFEAIKNVGIRKD